MMNALAALVLATALPPAGTWSVDAAASTVRYTVVHRLHQVEGASHEVEAKAAVRDGAVLAMVRVPVASFRSGDANRDGHMAEAVEAGKFPFVVVKARAALGAGRELPPGPLAMEAEVELHGVKTPVTVPVTVTARPDGALEARGAFDVSLDAHHVDRPSLLFVRIDDTCHLDFDLVLRGAP